MNPAKTSIPHRKPVRLPVDHCVLSVIQRDYLCIGATLRIRDAKSLLQMRCALHPTPAYILVVDLAGRYQGAVRYRDLLLADSDQALESLKRCALPLAKSYEDKFSVAQRLHKSRAPLLPVLDGCQRVIGVLDQKDAQALLALQAKSENRSFFRRLSHRFWPQ